MSLSPGEPAATPNGTQPAAAPQPATGAPGGGPAPLRPPGLFGGGLGGGWGRGSSAAGAGAVPRSRSRIPARLIVGVLCALVFFTTATRIAPAIRAGLHDGTRGAWVATNRKCVHSACTWQGNFVLPNGHVLQTATQYEGQLPATVHPGTSVPALYTGGSGTAFPANGSDLWISLLVALLLSALGLYWAMRRWVLGYFRQRREQDAVITAPRH
jgi:hypothetical protein